MKNIIKMELKKALFSKYFLFGLSLLMLFALLSAAYMIEIRMDYNPDGLFEFYMEGGKFTTNPDLPLFGFYNSWLGGEDLSLAYVLFFNLLPIGAALPFGWSFYTERKSGYLKNIASRINKEHYFIAKTIAVFVSGMLAVLIPMLVNVLLVSAFVPAIDPFVGYTFYNHTYFGTLWVDLLYTNPLLHMLLYILLNTVYGGIFALLSFAVAFYVKNIFAVIFLPFLSMMLFKYLETVYYASKTDLLQIEFVPTSFLHSRSPGYYNLAWSVALVTAVLFAFALITIAVRGKRDEIF